jgi:hypothetical protein
MSKYQPLEKRLETIGKDFIPMTFAEIESVIDDDLPPSARKHRAWWSNNPSNSVITYAWLGAGYKTENVDMEGESLVFHRVGKSRSVTPEKDRKTTPRRHPVFGCMGGAVNIAEGVDLTKPASPDWEHITHDMDRPE